MNAADRVRLDRMPQWHALAQHRERLGEVRLRTLFAEDPKRSARYGVRAGELYLDYAKHLITDETLALLCELAVAARVPERRDAMFRGEKRTLPRNMLIGPSEARSLLQSADSS
jgi:glucose-6-phosphate isomerase